MRLTDKLGIQPELREALTTLGAVAIPFGTPVNAVASTAVLKVTTLPTAGETITIGDIVYTFVANATPDLAPGQIELEANVGDTRPNIVAAINGTDGHNVLNPLATAGAFAGADSTLTATTRGVLGDDIVADTDMVGADNEISAFTGGINGTPGVRGAVCLDASRIYVAIDTNTISGNNWRRIANDFVALA
jgi:hypothetical protein